MFLALFGTQLVHELGHAVAAKIHNVSIQFPIVLPSLQLGLYGAITRFLSYPKDRKALFDISIAGPFMGFLVGLIASFYGISETISASPDLISSFPAIPSGFFTSSFLFNEILNNFLQVSQVSTAQLSDAVPSIGQSLIPVVYIHPSLAVGLVALLVNALNFLPIGRLDGGRVAMAVGGRRASGVITFIFLLLQAVSLATNVSPVNLAWIVAVAIFQRSQDMPPEDDVSPVATDEDDRKKGLLWFGRLGALALCLTLTALIMLPAVNIVDPSFLPPGGPSSPTV